MSELAKALNLRSDKMVVGKMWEEVSGEYVRYQMSAKERRDLEASELRPGIVGTPYDPVNWTCGTVQQ